MTAVISASPGSGFSVPLNEDDEAQSWEFLESIDNGAGAAAGSYSGSGSGELVFAPPTAGSPSIISQGSWGLVQQHNHHAAGHHQQQTLNQTPSPVMSSQHSSGHSHSHSQSHSHTQHALSPSPYSGTGTGTFGVGDVSATASMNDGIGGTPMMFDFASNMPLNSPQQQQQHHHQQHQTSHDDFVTQALLSEQVAAFSRVSQDFGYSAQDLMMTQFSGGFGNSMQMMPDASFNTLDPQAQLAQQLGIPLSMQGNANVEPWDPTRTTSMQASSLVTDHFTPPAVSDGSSVSLSPRAPLSPPVKQEPRSATKKTAPQPMAGPRRASSGIQKTQKKRKSSSATRSRSDSPDQAKIQDGMFMFCNQTQDTWANGGVVDMEHADRPSAKGRKGGLSEEKRANALRVRQVGACFCCRMRKVACDGERPCRQCKKLCTQVPEAVCWKFADFNAYLFPEFIRGHLQKEQTAQFITDNVASFTLNGVDTPCTVTLSSGITFASKLVIRAKFFTAKNVTSDAMQQWFHFIGDRGVDLESLRAAPIGLDIADGSGSGSQRNELRRKVEAYMDALVSEPSYSLQLTDAIRKTTLPREVLQLVHKYAQQSSDSIVRRALAIYAMHYVMTRQLTMTQQSIASLQMVNPVAATGPYMTPRLLNRQIKTIVDDVMQHEVQALFDDFTSRLKKKHQKEWAPCMAAFLVFTLLMEAVEAAADVFAITDNEIEMRSQRQARFRRSEALNNNMSIENMAFKQFAFQFHNIYSTHSRDGAGKTFNPLNDTDGWEELRQLDPAAAELVSGLRTLTDFNCE